MDDGIGVPSDADLARRLTAIRDGYAARNGPLGSTVGRLVGGSARAYRVSRDRFVGLAQEPDARRRLCDPASMHIL